jgi:hypothetical protein
MERPDTYHDERLFEIQLLRKRIERLRNTLCGPRRELTQRNEQISEPRQTVERSKEDELNDIKAKLLGRKK